MEVSLHTRHRQLWVENHYHQDMLVQSQLFQNIFSWSIRLLQEIHQALMECNRSKLMDFMLKYLQEIINFRNIKETQKKQIISFTNIITQINSQNPGQLQSTLMRIAPKNPETVRQLNVIQKQHDDLQKDFFALQQQHEHQIQQLTVYNNEINQLKATLSETERNLQNKISETKYLQNQRVVDQAEKKRIQQELTDIICQKDNLIKNMKEDAKDAANQHQQKVKQLNDQILQLKSDISVQELKYEKQLKQQNDILTNKINATNEQNNKYSDQISEQLKEMNLIKQEFIKHKEVTMNLQLIIQGKDAQIENLSRKIEEVRNGTKDTIESQAQQIEKLTHDLAVAQEKRDNSDLHKKITLQGVEIYNLNNALKIKTQESLNHINQRDKLKQSALTAEFNANQYKNELKQIQNSIENKEIEKYKNGYNSKILDQSYLQQQQKLLLQENDILKKKLNEYKNMFNEQNEQIQKLNKDIKMITDKNKMAKEISGLRQKMLQQQQQIKTLQNENTLLNQTQLIETMLRRKEAVSSAMSKRAQPVLGKIK